jgi:hypothetical protein
MLRPLHRQQVCKSLLITLPDRRRHVINVQWLPLTAS